MTRSTSTPPLVSVVIPAYNRADSIRASVESVLRQSFTDFEVIVVDDRSQDDTMRVLNDIDDPRLSSFQLPQNSGACAARNAGIEASRGRFIAFQDSDDEWLPRKLEKQMARLTEPGANYAGAYCGMIILGQPTEDQDKRASVNYFPNGLARKVEGNLLPGLLASSMISTQTLVTPRELLIEIGKFDEQMMALQDWECVLRLARHGEFAFIDEPLVIQRFSPNSISCSQHKRVASRKRIVEKNFALLADRPQLLAAHYRAIGGGHAQLGETGEARRWLIKALRLAPFKLHNWLSFLRIHALWLGHRFR